VLGRRRAARQRLRGPERQQHRRSPLGRGRLLQRPPPERDGRVRGPAPHRRARGRLQALDHPGRAAPGRLEQLRGHLLVRRASVPQHDRRSLVQQAPLARRELVVDRVAHERVHEAQRRVGTQDLGPRQLAGGSRHRRLGQGGQGGHGRHLRAIAEHADRARDGDRVPGQPLQSQEHGAGGGPGTYCPHHLHLSRLR
jgi:hypothetical protein